MPPIGYPGNSISKEARAKAGGGFESAIEVAVEPTGEPTISAVVDNGDGTISISGSNFGSKAQPAPAKFERFEGTAGQKVDAYDPEWIAYSDGGSTIRSERSHSGSTSAGVTSPGDPQFATNYFTYTPSDVVRVGYWYYIDCVSSDTYGVTQVKGLRVTSTGASGGGGPYNGTGNFTFGGIVFDLISGQPNSIAEGPISFDNGSVTLSPDGRFMFVEENAWNRVDMLVKLSDPGVANGSLGIIVSSPALGTTKKMFENIVTRAAGQSFQNDAAILGNMIANYSSGAGNPISVFSDDVYIDTTWAMVEIGDNPDYLSCTRRDVLPPTAWSGNSVTVSENFGPVPVGTNYIFVTNENGDFNTAGFEVTI